MENEIKYIYSADGVQIEEIEKILEKCGLDDQINELIETGFNLIRNENFDRTQLEMYVLSTFQFGILGRLMADPTCIEKYNEECNRGRSKDDGE